MLQLFANSGIVEAGCVSELVSDLEKNKTLRLAYKSSYLRELCHRNYNYCILLYL
jgi:hypothetical protein